MSRPCPWPETSGAMLVVDVDGYRVWDRRPVWQRRGLEMRLLEPLAHRPIELAVVGLVDRQQLGVAVDIDGKQRVERKRARARGRVDRGQRHHIGRGADLGDRGAPAGAWTRGRPSA